MRNTLRIGIALLATFAGDLAFAGEGDNVSATVSLDTQITQLWRARHPSKWFKCWGDPDEVKVWDENLKGASQANVGQSSASFDNPKESFGVYSPVSAKWLSELSDDRVFRLEFSQEIVREQRKTHAKSCNTYTWYSQLTGLANKFQSHASIVIPANVYLIRILRTRLEEHNQTTHELKSWIDRAQPILEDGPLAEVRPWHVKVEGADYVYYVVRPGDRIDFTVEWESQAIENAGFKVEYEIKMLGAELCAQNLWNPHEVTGERILPHVRALFTVDRYVQRPHEVMAALACLRDPAYVNTFLRENHGAELVRFLSALNDTWASVETLQREPGGYFRELWLATRLTIYDLARGMLNDMARFCSTDTVLLLFPHQKPRPVSIRGYHFAARVYYKIQLDLLQAPVALLKDFAALVNGLGAKGMTYALAKNTPNKLEELQYAIFASPFRTFSVIRARLASLPTLKVGGSYSRAIQDALARGDAIYDDLEVELHLQLRAFARGNQAVLNAEELDKKVKSYEGHLRELTLLLQSDIDWLGISAVDGALSGSEFSKSMWVLNQDLMRLSGNLLEIAHGKKLGLASESDFLKLKDMNELSARVGACLRQSHD